jgi:hypothetical protein
MLSSAETYIPGGKTIRKGLLGGRPSAAAPPKLEDVRLEQKDVNSIQDTVWTVSNQAQSRLLKRTGQPAIAAKMEADMKRDQRERVIVKQKRPPKKVLMQQLLLRLQKARTSSFRGKRNAKKPSLCRRPWCWIPK